MGTAIPLAVLTRMRLCEASLLGKMNATPQNHGAVSSSPTCPSLPLGDRVGSRRSLDRVRKV